MGRSINIVVDTNVILETNNFFWNVLIKNVPNMNDQIRKKINLSNISIDSFNIVIPQVVVEEIDNLKRVISNNKGYLQRKQIQKLYLYINKVKLVEDKRDGIKEKFSDIQKQDNLILNTVINMKNESDTVLYTNDIQLLLKQKIYNIDTFTDIEKIDVNKLLESVEYINVNNNDKLINKLLSNGYCENELKLKRGYYIIQNKKNNLKEVIKVKNDELIEHIPLIDKDKFQNHNNMYDLKLLFPKTPEQQIFLDQILDHDIKLITSVSPSGTGKTLLQLYGQINLIMKEPDLYRKITFIVNPTSTNGKDIGYLPGDKHEKIIPYMQGILDNLQYLFHNEIPDEFNIEKFEKTDLFEIRPLQFIRGSSISHSIVIVDEVQNLTLNDIKTIVSRVQNNSKLILLGDVQQIDEKIQIDYTGIMRFLNYLYKYKDKINWVNITMKDRIRNEILNILDDFFDEQI